MEVRHSLPQPIDSLYKDMRLVALTKGDWKCSCSQDSILWVKELKEHLQTSAPS